MVSEGDSYASNSVGGGKRSNKQVKITKYFKKTNNPFIHLSALYVITIGCTDVTVALKTVS